MKQEIEVLWEDTPSKIAETIKAYGLRGFKCAYFTPAQRAGHDFYIAVMQKKASGASGRGF